MDAIGEQRQTPATDCGVVASAQLPRPPRRAARAAVNHFTQQNSHASGPTADRRREHLVAGAVLAN
jgi:hypothetical protein